MMPVCLTDVSEPLPLPESEGYLPSLVEWGQKSGRLSLADASRIFAACIAVLQRQIALYTNGQSTSVRVETARELLSSVFYTVSSSLRHFTREEGLCRLCQTPADELFAEGQASIRRRLRAMRQVHLGICRALFETPNSFYAPTVRDGINGFFKLYRPALFAQETHLTLDYPSFFDWRGRLCGIGLIERYLEEIALENRFCRFFSADTVHGFLLNVNEMYAATPMNLFAPVFSGALCCVLLGEPVGELLFDVRLLESLLCSLSREESLRLFEKAAEELCREFSCTERMKRYLTACAPAVGTSLCRLANLGAMQNGLHAFAGISV